VTSEKPTLILTDQISDWIYTLHQSASNLPQETFKDWCFNHINSLLEFDSALWVSRSDMEDKVKLHWTDDTFLFKQPREFVDNYAQIDARPHNTDVLNQRLSEAPGKFFSVWECCDKAQFIQTEYYLEHCVKYGLEHAISALMLPGEFSTIAHIISFYRSDNTHEFTAQEKCLADFIFPHLLEAYSDNLLASFKLQSKASYRGVIDRFGEMVVAQSGFADYMEEKGLCVDSKVTIEVISDLTANETITVKEATLKLHFQDGLIYIEATEPSPVEKLSDRQLEICFFIVKGCSNKDIASYLELSVSTVNNHVRNIFGLLKIKNRAALTSELIRQGKF
jgi:DNA-binding CsgD family transcriptional regulator